MIIIDPTLEHTKKDKNTVVKLQWSAIVSDLPLDYNPQVDEMLQRRNDLGFAASSF